MANVKVTTRWDVIEAVDGFNSPEFAQAIGDQLREEVIDSLSKGISPVQGERKFEPYKNPKSYPGKRKPSSPVNLFLSGDLYRALEARLKGNSIIFGIFDPKVAKYAQAHQDGNAHLPRRAIVPDDGEVFQVSILRAILDLYKNRMAVILKSSNKK